MLLSGRKTQSTALPTAQRRHPSAGYHFSIRPERGEFDGKPYTLRMHGLQGHHAILCSRSRAGDDLRIPASLAVALAARRFHLPPEENTPMPATALKRNHASPKPLRRFPMSASRCTTQSSANAKPMLSLHSDLKQFRPQKKILGPSRRASKN